MAVVPITYDEMMRVEFVIGVFERLRSAPTLFQNFYSMGPTDADTEPILKLGRS